MKKLNPALLELYVITDRGLSKGRSTVEVVAATLAGGAKIIQLREKKMSTGKMIELAKQIKELTEKAGAKLIINDRVDVALAVNADGVHLGDNDMSCSVARQLLGPDKIIGKSVDTAVDAQKAEAEGADYLGAGAVFATATKEEAPAIGISGLRAVCQSTYLPVVAIGGIKVDKVQEIMAIGAAGVAVVSGVVSAEDITAACEKFLAQIRLGRLSGKED